MIIRVFFALVLALIGLSSAHAAGCAGTGNCYWVGGTGNASDTTHWATTDGGATTGSVPTAADNCNFTINSNAVAYTVTIDASTACKDMAWANPLVGAPTLAGASALSVAGSLTLVSGMGWTNTSTITFTSTATGKTITTAAVLLANNITFNGVGGGWTNQDALTTGSGNTLLLTAGTWSTGAQTIAAGIVNISGSTTRVATLPLLGVGGWLERRDMGAPANDNRLLGVEIAAWDESKYVLVRLQSPTNPNYWTS